MRRRIGEDGWPVDIEAKLIEALLQVPQASEASRANLEVFARTLMQAAELGEFAELPRFRPAYQDATDLELRQFGEICGKLAEHIRTMRRPAYLALESEGMNLSALTDDLIRAAETALYAGGSITEEDYICSGPRKQQAAMVTDCAAKAFEKLAGRRPTYTTDPHNSQRSGAWPEFLDRVFKALDIDASVNSQVRAPSTKYTPR